MPNDLTQNSPTLDPNAVDPNNPPITIPAGMLLGEKGAALPIHQVESFAAVNELAPTPEQNIEKETITNLALDSRPAPIQTPPDPPQQQPTPKLNVVNKTTRKEALHPVSQKADETTIAADKEEADFITKVEETHAGK